MGDSTIFMLRDATYLLLLLFFIKSFTLLMGSMYTGSFHFSPGQREYKAVTKSQGDLGISQTQVSDSRLLHFTSYAGLPNCSPYAAVKWHALATSVSSVTPQQWKEKQKGGVILLTRPNLVNSFVLVCAGGNVKTKEYTLKLVSFVSEKALPTLKE